MTEVERLREELRRVTEERDCLLILMDRAAYWMSLRQAPTLAVFVKEQKE